MKKTFLTITLLGAFLAFQPAQSQVRFGVQGGLNVSALSSMNNALGFHAGVTSEIPLFLGLHFNPGIMFSMKGSQESTTVAGVKGDHRLTASFIEVPLFFSYKLSISDGIAIVPHVGPFIGYGIAGQNKFFVNDKEVTGLTGDVFGEPTMQKPTNLNAKAFQAGFGFGVSVQLGILQIGAGYDMPLTEFIEKTAVSDARKMSNIRVSLGILF